MIIREYNHETDSDGLRQCVISIQDYERNIDSRMPKGVDIVDEYIHDMFEICKETDGMIFIADIHDSVAGYVLLLSKVKSETIDDGVSEYGLVRDLVVLEGFRGQGVGGKLLHAVENEAEKANVGWLRIEVLSSNEGAKAMYLSKGFKPYTSLLEKKLS